MANREAFLDRLAQKMERDRITQGEQVPKPKYLQHPWDHIFAGASQQELVDGYKVSLEALGGKIIDVAEHAQLPHAIQTWLDSLGAKNIVAWQEESSYGQALLTTMQDLDRNTYSVTLWDEHADSTILIDAAEKADVGFTVARHGLAETGTTVLYNRGNCGRLVSLLPTICAIILPASTIIARLTQVLPELAENHQDFSCFNLITGPSRSADIEMSLSIGVHGPGQIAVFLVDDLA